MEFDARHPDSSARLRLIDVRLRADEESLHFGGGLAGVFTASADRSMAAHQIVRTVMGPRPADSSGSVDINGRLVSVHSLPPLPLPPSAPAVLDCHDLSAHWQALCARRRGELAATHASRRLERHRIAAALDRARAREAGRIEPGDARAWSAGITIDTTHPVSAAGASADLRTRIRELMRSIDALSHAPVPEALALAAAWDAHTELLRNRASEPTIDLEAAEGRVRLARMAVAMRSPGVPDEDRDEIDWRHRNVVEAEARLFEARRKNRVEAVARYESAVEAEKLALAEAGVDSYASFLFAITGGAGPLEDRQAAQEELVNASAALDAAHRATGVTAHEDLHARGVELRADAERLLGRAVVGGDPPAELRALRVESPGRAERVHELIEVLEAAGVVRGDAIQTARELLASDPPERTAGSGVVATLEEAQAKHECSLGHLESEIARLDQIYAVDVDQIAAHDLAEVIESLLDAYRAGNLLGGRLPVVLDGAFDGLTPEARDAAVRVLSRAADVQSIVVTDDLDVMKSVTDAGGTVVLWPESTDVTLGNQQLQSTPRPGA